tara:strand:+ start:73 stop:285 length:213 start_codon:yes stop_codon:yes gene_type:complete
MTDQINPNHYKTGNIETYDFIIAKNLSYALGNVIKYIVRHKYKGGIVDLEKAKWYLQKAIDEYDRSKGSS